MKASLANLKYNWLAVSIVAIFVGILSFAMAMLTGFYVLAFAFFVVSWGSYLLCSLVSGHFVDNAMTWILVSVMCAILLPVLQTARENGQQAKLRRSTQQTPLPKSTFIP